MPPERKTAVERQREAKEAEWVGVAITIMTATEPADLSAAVVSAAAYVFDSRAELAAELKRTGWKTVAAEYRTAAACNRALAEILKSAPTPGETPPTSSGVDIVPRSAQGGVAALEDRLVDAFGPELRSGLYDGPVTPAVAADLRRRIESEVDGQPESRCNCTGIFHPIGADGCVLAEVDGHGGSPFESSDPDQVGYGTLAEPAPAPICDNGPTCPAHPGIQVNHPAEAPTDAVVGPTGGTERRPREETSVLPPLTDAGPTPSARPRLTYPELYARRASHGTADHRSVSQVQAASDCGVKFALYREPEQAPAWWNVAGTALHACIEQYERMGLATVDPTPEIAPWLPTFFAEIEKVRTATGVPVDRWRAARSGSENYDWWRVSGEEYLKMYVAWSQARHAAGWHILTLDGGMLPVIEYPFALDVNGVKVDGFIDQVWSEATDYDGRPISKIEIIDLKFGSSKPDDRFQLGVYAHALSRALGTRTIGGAFYLGRKGELHGHTDDLDVAVPWDDVVHRVLVTEQIDRAGFYLPRRSSFCRSCGVSDLCPAGAS